MGDSYREALKRNRAAIRAGVGSLGLARTSKAHQRAAAILEARRKEKAKQVKLW